MTDRNYERLCSPNAAAVLQCLQLNLTKNTHTPAVEFSQVWSCPAPIFVWVAPLMGQSTRGSAY